MKTLQSLFLSQAYQDCWDDYTLSLIHICLKITLYEQELEKQKIEMDYLKIQIRQHFYMNCLNFIYLSLIHIWYTPAADDILIFPCSIRARYT